MIENVIKQLAPKGYLRAAINLSNFLLVTGKESNGDPQGVSPDMAKALANELNVDIKLITFNRPGELADAILEDAWDIGNIANEPERAKSITFSLPYTTIESTFLIRNGLNINSLQDVDKKGIKIAVAERSAYDLWLTENIKNADLIRAKSIDESFSVFQENKYEVLAGLMATLVGSLLNTFPEAVITQTPISKNLLSFVTFLICKYNLLRNNKFFPELLTILGFLGTEELSCSKVIPGYPID